MPSPSSPMSPIVASNMAKRTWPTARPSVLAITQRSQSALPPGPTTVAAVLMRAFCTASPQIGTRPRRLRLPNERDQALGPSHVVDVGVSELAGQELLFDANPVRDPTASNDEDHEQRNPRLQSEPEPDEGHDLTRYPDAEHTD